MERIIKIFLIIFCLSNVGNAAEQILMQPVMMPINPIVPAIVQPMNRETQQIASPVIPQLVSFERCTKLFNINVDKLFFLSLASINANRFTIDEIQSKSGYILFSVANRQFLATISKINDKSSMLKIVPADNNYYFPIGVISNFYKYIELNLMTPIEKLS